MLDAIIGYTFYISVSKHKEKDILNTLQTTNDKYHFYQKKPSVHCIISTTISF